MCDNTKLENDALKCCKICNEIKIIKEFPINRRTCKKCTNEAYRKKMQENPELRKKRSMDAIKNFKLRMENEENYEKHCEKRRKQYRDNEEFRKKIIEDAIKFKQKKKLERDLVKQQEQQRIGVNNKLCNYCEEIKSNDRFRHNRLKCKDCERDDPIEKIKRVIRGRIHSILKKNKIEKDSHTVEYLGCSIQEYLDYLLSYDNSYTLENHGTEWHIDHVIPLSLFDMEDESDKNIAFNWRNTMPLSKYENLAKNNRISQQQLARHLEYLNYYHKQKNIEIPQIMLELFAKHLVVPESP